DARGPPGTRGDRVALRGPGCGARRAEGARGLRPPQAGRARDRARISRFPRGHGGRGAFGEPPGRSRGLRAPGAAAEPRRMVGVGWAWGELTLRGPKGGEVLASIVLKDGKLTEIRRGKLEGEVAFYQLFERPLPGQFSFVKGAGASAAGTPREILPLTLEAMRRYGGLQEAEALVPRASRVVRASVPPTPLPGESDGSFLQAVWERASQGGTALDCEAAVASDSYRIRRALAHWVEGGALKIQGKA